MSKKSSIKDRIELEKSKKQFEKIVTVSLIIGIIVVSGFIIYYILNQEPGFITFGILNSEGKAEDFPINVSINEDVDFYVTIDNYLRDNFKFFLKVLKGANSSSLSPSGSEGAELDFITTPITLSLNECWISNKLSVSFSEIGSDQLLIVELWQYIGNNDEKFYDLLWLRLNIVSST